MLLDLLMELCLSRAGRRISARCIYLDVMPEA
jgi:hypothetical protein